MAQKKPLQAKVCRGFFYVEWQTSEARTQPQTLTTFKAAFNVWLGRITASSLLVSGR